jgi:hypothetical protein
MNETDHEFQADAVTPLDADLPLETRGLADQLMPLFYDDLKRLAHRERSRVGAGQTLQTTALVNEVYQTARHSHLEYRRPFPARSGAGDAPCAGQPCHRTTGRQAR